MVAVGVRLPNVKKQFIPDPGYYVFDADLSGADAQVVAYEAGDMDLIAAFKSGIKIHVHNVKTMWPEYADADTDFIKELPHYKWAKAGVHACNYGASVGALIAANGWTREFATEFQGRWFEEHPEIKEWHHRVERGLLGLQCWNCYSLDVSPDLPCSHCGVTIGRCVKNAFGFRRKFMGELERVLPAALAWSPQSTVGLTCDLGWINISRGYGYASQHVNADLGKYILEKRAHEKYSPFTKFLLQVHDSAVGLIRKEHIKELPNLVNDLRIKIPYPSGELIIPWSFAYSPQSWGDC